MNILGDVYYEEVFYHITMDCNLRCKHCYAGDHLIKGQHGDSNKIINEITHFRELGTKKIVLLGGEPTIHPGFVNIFTKTLELGFSQVIVDTNGQIDFPIPRYPYSCLKTRFSFEGSDAQTNDQIRGIGAFYKSISNLKKLIARGINCEITCTINRYNFRKLPEFIEYFASIGIQNFNFHFLSITGTAKYNQHLILNPEEILEVQALLQTISNSKKYVIRFPKLLVREDEILTEQNKGLKCLIGSNKRVLVFNDGRRLFCPLELSQQKTTHGKISKICVCPYEELLFPQGLPSNYKMTFISWK